MGSDIVIGIDSSTTATKAIAWDVSGYNIAEGISPIPLSSPRLNHYEQDPSDWWNSVVTAVRRLMQQIDKERIKALSIANQRETFVALDKNGNALRPAIIWLDERCKDQVGKFSGLIGKDRIHRLTGKPEDYAPVVYRLSWMKEHENEIFRKVYKFSDVHGYIVRKLTGDYRTSWASADPLGLFDLEKKKWSADILYQLDITEEHLPEAFRTGTILGEVSKTASDLTGLKKGTPVVAGGGDGQSAGLGVNAQGSNRAYLNLGTAVVSGTYVDEYIVNRAFRTMIACSERGYYCETSLRAGTFLIDWFIKKLLKADRNIDIYTVLEEEACNIPPGSEGVIVLPYWNAVMNPWWDPDARGSIIGLSSSHNRGHLYRAILEGIALEQSLATRLVEEATGEKTEEFALIGGGAKSELWRQIIADTCAKRILRMVTEEASSLGAGITAAVAAGWFETFKDAAENMTRVKEITEPIPENMSKYEDLMTIYRGIYPGIKRIYRRDG